MSASQGSPPSGRAVFKDAIQNTGIYFIPLFAQRICGILLLPFTSRVITTADYGMLSMLELISFILSVILCGNFAGALGYFYFLKDSDSERRSVTGTAVAGALFLGSLAALICWPFRALLAHSVFRSDEALLYLSIVFITMPLGFVIEALFGWLRVANRPGAYAIGSFLKTGFTVAGILILVVVLKFRVLGYLYTTLGVLCLMVAGLGWYCWTKVRPTFNAGLFVRMLRFAVPLGLSGVAMFIVNFGDRFILRQYRPFSEVGIYDLAYKIGMLVSFVYGAFHAYWSAQVFQIVRREDAKYVFGRFFTYLILGLLFCSIVLVVGSGPGLHLLNKPFRAAAPLVPLIVGAYFVRSIGEFVRCLFLAAGHPGYEAVCNWAGGGVCVAAYFLLIPRYGMWGAAIATGATFLVIAAISLVWTYRLNPYRVEGVRLLKLAVAGGAALVPHFLIPVSSLAGQIGWSVLLLATFPAVLWLLGFPTPGEWETLRLLKRRYLA
jgi:O-antigen/teichoic acid export membrane protein